MSNKVKIKSLTLSTITFNSISLILQGQNEATVEIVSDADERELAGLEKSGLIEVSRDEDTKQTGADVDAAVADAIKTVTGSTAPVDSDDASSINNQEESSVIAVSAEGKVVKGQMKHRVEGTDEAIENSEAGQRSMAAMKKLEAEERGEYTDDTPVDESKLDLSDRMGLEAVVSTGAGIKKVKMENSVVPDSKPADDPFIDKAEKEEIAAAKAQQRSDSKVEADDNFDPLSDDDTLSDDESEKFIEI